MYPIFFSIVECDSNLCSIVIMQFERSQMELYLQLQENQIKVDTLMNLFKMQDLVVQKEFYSNQIHFMCVIIPIIVSERLILFVNGILITTSIFQMK